MRAPKVGYMEMILPGNRHVFHSFVAVTSAPYLMLGCGNEGDELKEVAP